MIPFLTEIAELAAAAMLFAGAMPFLKNSPAESPLRAKVINGLAFETPTSGFLPNKKWGAI
ncbi:hypothetical protein [uncultured Roseovarius sp.]|uniref:hypothetical protein n=1 Tax=uncultured Roseovarius sp. TaxID=293344 RepID=UPI00263301FB|nr:hypothetical protein [uncultured Roseovarius sp.]